MVSNSSNLTLRRTDIAHADVLHEVGVQIASLVHLLQQAVHHEVEVCILEAALLALGERRSHGQGNDNVVGVLLCTGKNSQISDTELLGWYSHSANPALAGREM